MADASIEWATKVWNAVRGCSIVSKGCTNCYAMKQAHRFAGPGGKYEGLTKMSGGGPVWTGEVRVVPEMLEAPLHWKKPQRVFVNSMSDLFHEDVPDSFIDQVFAVMAMKRLHTFQILTKRPERMRAYMQVTSIDQLFDCMLRLNPKLEEFPLQWPLPNVWLGVSVEDQATADERIPLLLETPAALRWVSCEPQIAPIDFADWLPGGKRDDRGGDGVPGADGARFLLDRRARSSLEAQGMESGQQDRVGPYPAHSTQSAARGCEQFRGSTCEQHNLPAGDVRLEESSLEGQCSPGRLDGREWRDDSRRPGDKPPGRQRREQPPGQSGAGISIAERDALNTSVGRQEKVAAGVREPCVSTDGCESAGDSPARGAEVDASERHREAVWDFSANGCQHSQSSDLAALDWIVVGGESGPGARPFDVTWARSIVEQCKEAGVPCFVKQLGGNHRGWCASETKELCGPDHVEQYDVCDAYEASEQGKHCEDYGRRCVLMRDRKGGDPSEWPADLRVREWPEVRS